MAKGPAEGRASVTNNMVLRQLERNRGQEGTDQQLQRKKRGYEINGLLEVDKRVEWK